MYKRRWQPVIALVLGLYVVGSPWFIPYFAPASTLAPIATGSYFATGTMITVVAVLARLESRPWEAWAVSLLGVWIIIAPWVLGFSAQRVFTWSSVIVGLMLVAASLGPLTVDSERSA